MKKVSAYKSAYFRRIDFENFSVATAVIFHCYRCVLTANILFHTHVHTLKKRVSEQSSVCMLKSANTQSYTTTQSDTTAQSDTASQ